MKMSFKTLSNPHKVAKPEEGFKLTKKSKTFKPQDFIGKFPFRGDSLDFQKDLR